MTAPLEDGDAATARDRLLRVRVSEARWWRRDQGPLLLRATPGGECLRLLSRPFSGLGLRLPGGGSERLNDRDAARLDGEFFIAYPRWRNAPATVRQWLALSRSRCGRSAVDELVALAAALAPLVPALAALLLASLQNPSWPVFLASIGCLCLGAILAGWATSLTRLRRGRDVNLRLHGLLWDRLFGSPVGAFDRLTPIELATRSREALSAAQHEAEASERMREEAIMSAASLAVVTAAMPMLTVIVGIELLAGYAVLDRLWCRVGRRVLAAGERTPAVEQALIDLGNLLPTFGRLGAQDWLLRRVGKSFDELITAGDAIESAIVGARTGGRVLLLLQPVTIGIATLFGLLPASSSLRIAAAMLAASAAADGIYRVSAITGTRPARRQRIAAAAPLLAFPANDAGKRTAEGKPAGRVEALSVENLGFAYGTAAPILRGVDLGVRRGEVVAITGPSGCGKTSLLRLILGQLEATMGTVHVSQGPSSDVEASQKIGAVFSDQELPPMTIRNFVAGAHRLPPGAVDDAIGLVGLQPAVARLPMGMQTSIVPGAFASGVLQRLMLARALAPRPELLLLDDALSALGASRCNAMLDELRRRGTAVVLTTQDPALLGAADRVLWLERGRLKPWHGRGTTAATRPPPAAPARQA